jgi:hypothetical protein
LRLLTPAPAGVFTFHFSRERSEFSPPPNPLRKIGVKPPFFLKFPAIFPAKMNFQLAVAGGFGYDDRVLEWEDCTLPSSRFYYTKKYL